MPLDFPDMRSLKSRAQLRGFRLPTEGEAEIDYRNAFADYMRPIDLVESVEIRNGNGWDKLSPEQLLEIL